MAKILIVEDDTAINELMERCLAMNGHCCLTAFSGGGALSIIRQSHSGSIDLILLDINLPDMDGFQMMKHTGEIPVIYVTARGEISDRVRGLNDGAEDYIVKPFDLQELIARVNAVLRRCNKETDCFYLDPVTVDTKNYKAYLQGKEIKLKRQEFELLKALILNKNITLTREQLLNTAWGWDYEGDERTVDVHIQRLRKKLHWEEHIKTIYKIGYRLET